jgi:hypothetical protein
MTSETAYNWVKGFTFIPSVPNSSNWLSWAKEKEFEKRNRVLGYLGNIHLGNLYHLRRIPRETDTDSTPMATREYLFIPIAWYKKSGLRSLLLATHHLNKDFNRLDRKNRPKYTRVNFCWPWFENQHVINPVEAKDLPTYLYMDNVYPPFEMVLNGRMQLPCKKYSKEGVHV